jgi:hypothetical protein
MACYLYNGVSADIWLNQRKDIGSLTVELGRVRPGPIVEAEVFIVGC